MLSFIPAFFRGLAWAWPFISEVFFEGKSFKEVVQQNKIVFVLLTSLLTLLVISLVLNYYSMTALHKIVNKDKEKEKAEAVAPPASSSAYDKELKDATERLGRIFDEPRQR